MYTRVHKYIIKSLLRNIFIKKKILLFYVVEFVWSATAVVMLVANTKALFLISSNFHFFITYFFNLLRLWRFFNRDVEIIRRKADSVLNNNNNNNQSTNERRRFLTFVCKSIQFVCSAQRRVRRSLWSRGRKLFKRSRPFYVYTLCT